MAAWFRLNGEVRLILRGYFPPPLTALIEAYLRPGAAESTGDNLAIVSWALKHDEKHLTDYRQYLRAGAATADPRLEAPI